MNRLAPWLLAGLITAGCGGGAVLRETAGTSAAPPAESVRARTQGAGQALMERSLAQSRWLVFHTNAALVPEDANGTFDVYLKDLEQGTVQLVSRTAGGAAGNRASSFGSLSADGTRIAYSSDATNLVSGDTNGRRDVFVHDVAEGTTSLVSVTSAGAQTTGTSTSPALSADGTLVFFLSNGLLAPQKTTTAVDVFVRDLQTNQTSLVTTGLAGAGGNGSAAAVSASSDGRYVAVVSAATNLVAGDTNGAADVFLVDRQAGQTQRVSVAASGMQGNGACANPSVSDDGRYVAWDSVASNLAPGDTNGRRDVFLRDRTQGTTARLSVSVASQQGSAESSQPTLSRDGTLVAFTSASSELGANGMNQVFWREVDDPATLQLASGTDGQPGESPSDQAVWDSAGNSLAYRTGAGSLAPGASPASPAVALLTLATPPETPTALTAWPDGGQAHLSWAGSLGAEGYEVLLDGAVVATTTGTTATVTGLTNGQTYSFRVRAVNGGGASAATDPAVTTLVGVPVWAFRAGTTTQDNCENLAVGPNGNVYVVGSFPNTLTAGTTSLTSAGGNDAFVIALNPDGQFLWAARTGGTGSDSANGVVATSTRVYVSGWYSGTPTGFASAAGGSTGGQDAFVAALDPATGAPLWAVRGGGNSNDRGGDLTADGTRLYVTGAFSSSATGFLSGLSSAGDSDVFVAALSQANGSLQWAVRSGSTGAEEGWGVAVDASRIYVSGIFNGLPTGFLASGGESAGQSDGFVAALNLSNGAAVWSVRGGGTSTDWARSVACSGSRVFATGSYQGTPIGILSSVGASAGSRDGWLAALGASNGSLLWVKRQGGTGFDEGTDVAVQGTTLYASGVRQASAVTGYSTPVHPPTGSSLGIFAAALEQATGDHLWGNYQPGTGGGFTHSLAASAGGVFVSGSCSFGSPGFAASAGPSAGSVDVMVSRLFP